jgi:mono/diheme cytochrome c family protein
MKSKKEISIITLMAILLIALVGFKSAPVQDKWVAPASADKITNPLKDDATAANSGKKLYKVLCSVCHGMKGKGDGMGGAGLTPRPANLISDAVQSQTDGAIFWKMTEGRTSMASYKSSIPDKKRWQIVNYIRTLKK